MSSAAVLKSSLRVRNICGIYVLLIFFVDYHNLPKYSHSVIFYCNYPKIFGIKSVQSIQYLIICK